MFFGKRSQALARDGELRGKHAELAALGRDDFAGDPDVVAEVDIVLPGFERLLAGGSQRQHHLQVAGTVAQRGKDDLSADAVEHDPSHDGRLLTSGHIDVQVRELLAKAAMVAVRGYPNA